MARKMKTMDGNLQQLMLPTHIQMLQLSIQLPRHL